jgi:hypothetical protein
VDYLLPGAKNGKNVGMKSNIVLNDADAGDRKRLLLDTPHD